MKGKTCEDGCVNNAFRNSKATETESRIWYFFWCVEAHESNNGCKHIAAALTSNNPLPPTPHTLWPSLLCLHTNAVLIHFHCKSSFSCSVTQTKVLPWLIKFSRWSWKAITDPLGEGTVEPRPLSDSAANKGSPYKQNESHAYFS